MKILKWLLLLFSLPLFVACFEDNTTSANRPLSNITIEQGIDSVYNIYKFDTLVIKPVITQENVDKPLSYTWEIDLEPYSHDEVFEYVGNELGKFNCRLIVENEDGKSFFPFVLYVNSDYEYGITVLSCDNEGKSMLSFMQEPMTDDAVAQFTAYDCFTRNNPDTDFAAGAVDVVQCGGRLIIACAGGGVGGDVPAIYYLNEKTMVIENMFTVPEYDDFKPTMLGVPSVSPVGSIFPILCENGKVYDFSVTEGVVSEPLKLKHTYAQSCLVDVYGGYYDILLFDNDNKGMSLIYNGYGPYYCGQPYNMMLGDSLYATKNHFANRELISMVKIRMTPSQKNITGHQEFLAMSKLAGTPGVSTRSEVLYTDFWGYDYTNQESVFYTANQQLTTLMNNPITISTPCIANKTFYTLFFADGNKVRSWNYTSPLTNLPKATTLLAVGSPMAVITGFEMSEDHKVTYVSFYEPRKQGLNGSVWVFNTDTGEVLEKHENFCYRPVKMFYKTR
ncbi:MAG: hypothetical protein IKY19_08015 [Bacteroidaceae bacterium]|nr:hypothetical protein [Bacteroidaceae bacterium]